MIPSFDDRISSMIRALEDVISPSLPSSAGLAREQIQLVISHLKIIKVQLSEEARIAAGELADARGFAKAMRMLTGGEVVAKSLEKLEGLMGGDVDTLEVAEVRKSRAVLNSAICDVITAVFADGDESSRSAIKGIVLEQEMSRSKKDAEILKPFGFN